MQSVAHAAVKKTKIKNTLTNIYVFTIFIYISHQLKQ